MAATTTVRVRPETREAIARLSERRGIPAADYLGELVARAEEDELLEAMNDDFRDLKADERGWKRRERERSGWERTLLDGLADA
jgi:predicted DNA-binding protein